MKVGRCQAIMKKLSDLCLAAFLLIAWGSLSVATSLFVLKSTVSREKSMVESEESIITGLASMLEYEESTVRR